jgi:TonB family protein
MNQALLYRSPSKKAAAAAFALAAALHLSAVAFASRHHEVAVPVDFPLVLGYDPQPEPDFTPVPPADLPTDSTAPPDPQADFTEATPPPVHPAAKRPPSPGPRPPGRSSSSTGATTASGFRANTLSAARPDYPYEARRRHLTGSGLAIVTVDPASGTVLRAQMERSTGEAILDQSAISAFSRWRFKAGTPLAVRIPVVFTLSGVSL